MANIFIHDDYRPLPQNKDQWDKAKLTAMKNVYDAIQKKDRSFNSLHEAYGVIAEEFDELFRIVCLKPGLRDEHKTYLEAADIAFNCIRLMATITINQDNTIEEDNAPRS